MGSCIFASGVVHSLGCDSEKRRTLIGGMSGFNLFFFFNDTATTEIYTLSLHDALPILNAEIKRMLLADDRFAQDSRGHGRSEEHTSELQSQSNLVCRLLLEKKKQARYGYDRVAVMRVQLSPQHRPVPCLSPLGRQRSSR